ncbi:MAG: hypothetical protein RLY45_945 [Actinomycetota bacterium]
MTGPAGSPAPVEWVPLSGPLAAVHASGVAAPPLPGALARPAGSIVFVHGFTQTGRSWLPIAEYFVRAGHRCVLVDLPGHGDSTHVRADLRRTADMLGAVGGTAVYVGYSLGGRVCLHLALMYPHLVERLVLIGAHPGIDDDDERAARRTADDLLAQRLHDIGVPAFLREWVSQPLFGGMANADADLADRERNTIDGLASSLRMMGTGTQVPLWPRLVELTMPVLAMAGADDHKFAAVAAQLADAAPHARSMLVPGAAHAAHLQRPDAVVSAVEQFLREP